MTDLRALHDEAARLAGLTSRGYDTGTRLDALAVFARVVADILGELLPDRQSAETATPAPEPAPFDVTTAPPLTVLAQVGADGRPTAVWVHEDPGDRRPWRRSYQHEDGGYTSDWDRHADIPAGAVPLLDRQSATAATPAPEPAPFDPATAPVGAAYAAGTRWWVLVHPRSDDGIPWIWIDGTDWGWSNGMEIPADAVPLAVPLVPAQPASLPPTTDSPATTPTGDA